MKTVNAKVFAIKYWLAKKLNASLEKDKNAIKEGAKITFENYCKIQIVECTRQSYSKEAQLMIDEFAKKKGIEKQTTIYTRIDVDNVPTEVDDKVNQVLDTIESDNDRVITKVASGVARR